MKRAPISLADAVTAANELRPQDDETVDAVLQMLGLRGMLAAPPRPGIGVWKPSSSEEVTRTQRQQPRPLDLAPAWGASPAAARRGPVQAGRRSSVRLISQGSGVLSPPAWYTEPGIVLAPAATAASASPPPLFAQRVQRGILSAALATYVDAGELDVDAIVDTLAAVRPLGMLPRKRIPTLRRGVQLLLDVSPALDPFRADQRELVARLDDVLADDRLQVLHFAGCPGRGTGAGPRRSWSAWRAPAAGVPVVVVTDFGIGLGPVDVDWTSPDEWAEFAARVRAAGHPLMGLVPYEARRWPPRIAQSMTPLHWSEKTTATAVARAVREQVRRMR
jgi:hypothetical protein